MMAHYHLALLFETRNYFNHPSFWKGHDDVVDDQTSFIMEIVTLAEAIMITTCHLEAIDWCYLNLLR